MYGYLIAAIVMTLSVFESNSPIASIFKCDISYLWRVARSLCICRASCIIAKRGPLSRILYASYRHDVWLSR